MSARALSGWAQFDTSHDDQLADDLRRMVREYDADHDRSKQAAPGPSEVGTPCTRCLAAKILGVHDDPSDPWCRIIGTAVHAWLDEAALAWNLRHDDTRWVPEHKVFPDDELLPSGGSCDLYDERTRTVLDHKVVGTDRLRAYRINGPGIQYRRQAHLYGLGYTRKGHRVDSVALAVWPRGGRLDQMHLHREPYDETLAREALDRYRTMRDLVTPIGPAILPSLPSDPDCFTCSRGIRTAQAIGA